MLLTFASHGVKEGWMNNPLLNILMVVVATAIFLKFCAWAKGFTLSGGVKKVIFILTGLGLVGFNLFYSMGNKQIAATGDWGLATIALIVALAWIFVFAFALMSESKPVETE